MIRQKIIQTLWTKPYFENSSSLHNRFQGGWISEKYNAISWALSVSRLNRFYDGVELYTDTRGKKWLIDELQIPFKTVHIVLDKFDDLPSSLWAIPKIYIYSLQDFPFLHIDSDVFIWEPFKDEIINASLVAQNFEPNKDFNINALHFLLSNNAVTKLEDILNFKITENYDSINAGVIGGHDINFIKKYSNYALDYVFSIKEIWSSAEASKVNFIAEQYLYYQLAKKEQKKIQYLFEEVKNRYENLMDFSLVPYKNSYIHLISDAKQNPYACQMMGFFLEKDHEVLFQKIQEKYLNTSNGVLNSHIIQKEYTTITRSDISKISIFLKELANKNALDLTILKKWEDDLNFIISKEQNLPKSESSELLCSSFKSFCLQKDQLLAISRNNFWSLDFSLKKGLTIINLSNSISCLFKLNQSNYHEQINDDSEFFYLVFKDEMGRLLVKELIDEDLILYYLQGTIKGFDLLNLIINDDLENKDIIEEKIYLFLLSKLCYTSLIDVSYN